MLIVIFISIIINKNKILIFYYNLCYFIRFIIIFIYIFKDVKWNIISLGFRCHYYSIWLIILSLWILRLIIICLNNLRKIKIIIFLLLLISLIMFFISIDLILFYLIFEIRLIPTFFLIVYWGVNLERLNASYYLLLYMLLISFPLLLYIFKIYLYGITLKFSLILIVIEYYEFRFWGYIIIYIAFFIKIPIYVVHVWLPKAHVEAPVYGSIILAGVLLKIGRYGLIRILEIFINRRIKYNYLIFRVRIVGRILVGIVCLVQVDIKRLVAYSSVVHINLILCSIMTLYNLGFLRRYIIIISHGLCSSGLFYIVNIYYSRTMRRLLILNKGLIRKLSILILWWFILCSANFSFPFSINFIREIIILIVIINWDNFIIIYLILICFFRSAYSLYLFSYVRHGEENYREGVNYLGCIIKEYLIVIIHFFPLIIFLLNLVIFI